MRTPARISLLHLLPLRTLIVVSLFLHTARTHTHFGMHISSFINRGVAGDAPYLISFCTAHAAYTSLVESSCPILYLFQMFFFLAMFRRRFVIELSFAHR